MVFCVIIPSFFSFWLLVFWGGFVFFWGGSLGGRGDIHVNINPESECPNTFTLPNFSIIFYFKNNSTVSSLDLSSNGLGSAGLFYILEMLQSNKIISDIVSKVLHVYVVLFFLNARESIKHL